MQLTRIRNPAVGNQFSEENTKAPHVTLDTESAVVSGLGSSPFDWESKNKHHAFLVFILPFTNKCKSNQNIKYADSFSSPKKVMHT